MLTAEDLSDYHVFVLVEKQWVNNVTLAIIEGNTIQFFSKIESCQN